MSARRASVIAPVPRTRGDDVAVNGNRHIFDKADGGAKLSLSVTHMRDDRMQNSIALGWNIHVAVHLDLTPRSGGRVSGCIDELGRDPLPASQA